jgi:hypothetical protein
MKNGRGAKQRGDRPAGRAVARDRQTCAAPRPRAADLAEKVAIAPREWLERWLNDITAWKKFRRSRRCKDVDTRTDQTLPAALPLLEKAVVIESTNHHEHLGLRSVANVGKSGRHAPHFSGLHEEGELE